MKTERNRRLKAYRLKQFDFEFHQKAKFYLIEKGKTALSQRWEKERKRRIKQFSPEEYLQNNNVDSF